MVTGVARWMWDVTRVVEIQPHGGEIIVISRFADRDGIQLQSVPAGAWLPLRSPSGDALDDVLCEGSSTPSPAGLLATFAHRLSCLVQSTWTSYRRGIGCAAL